MAWDDGDSAFYSDDNDPTKVLAGIISPAPAHSLVMPPPSTPPRTGPGQTTPQTGSLAYAPTQAVAKNRDNQGAGFATGVSNPPNGGYVTSTASPMQAQPVQRPGLAGVFQQRLQGYNSSPAGVANSAVQPVMPTNIAGTGVQPVVPAGQPRQVVPDALNMQTQNDQARLAALTNSGSGISQIKNPVGRAAATAGDIALRLFAPGIEPFIGGTEGRHQMLVGQQQGIVGNDQAQQQARAQTEDTTQQSAQRAAKAQQDLADAQRDALRSPTAKESEMYNLDPDAQYRPRELGQLAIEANKGAKPDTIQGMYAAAVKDAMDRGVDPMKDPKVQSLADAQTSVQKQPATKAEQRDDRAIEILSKPPNQRTPGENAYMNGYNQWVKETKVDPGTARMSVLLQQPIAVADPNKPGAEVYTTKKNAIGMGAPGGVDTTAPKALVKDFTSGPDAKTLTNINTADAHAQQLGRMAKALQNGDIKALNQLANAWKEQTGNPAPTNFQMIKTALAAEIAKTTTGGAATVDETKEITKAINAANSPDALAGAAQTATELMHSKRQKLQDQYQQGMKGQPNFGNTNQGPARDPNMLYARDPQGKLHASPKEGAKPLPPGWKYDVQPVNK